jgi:hypothetical protein
MVAKGFIFISLQKQLLSGIVVLGIRDPPRRP